MKKIFVISLLIICVATTLKAKKRDTIKFFTKTDTLILNNEKVAVPRRAFLPDHTTVQYAGNIGFLSVGVGYNFIRWYDMTLMFGLQNEFFGRSKETIRMIAIKNTFNLYRPINVYKNISVIPTAGLSINWGYAKNTDSYVRIHLGPFIGSKIRYDFNDDKELRFKKAIELYFELGALETYIREWINNDHIKAGDVLNLAIGVRFCYR